MILVDIYVPSVDRTFDFELNEDTLLDELIRKIQDILSYFLHMEKRETEGSFLLCSYEKQRILDENQTLRQNGITNGAHLLLV